MTNHEGYPGAEMAAWKAPEAGPVPEARMERTEDPHPAVPDKAISVEAIRSSGPGGQNVNKVSSKIRVRVSVAELDTFSDRQKQLLREAAGHRWKENDDVIILECQDERDQPQNKRIAMERLASLITEALEPKKVRKPTKPSRASKRRRLDDKERVSQKKAGRRGGGQEGW